MSHISIRFVGNGVAPTNTRCKETAALITATEEMLSAMQNESEDDEDSFPICLTEIEDKSLRLKFAATQMVIALGLWQELAAVINTGRFEKLVPKAMKGLIEIVSFVKKRGCKAHIEDSNGMVIASFDHTICLPAEQRFKGGSSLLGEVVRVGGEEPKVKLRLSSGSFMSCETSEDIARKLGHRLYETVCCKGQATWDFRSGEIIKFKIEEVGPFESGPASEAFKSLSESASAKTIANWFQAIQ